MSLITIHIQELHVHAEPEGAIQKLDSLLAQGERLMASNQKIEQALADLDTKLTDLKTLVDTVVSVDATEDAAFQAEIDRLKAIVASGDAVTQENLDAIAAMVSARSERLTPVSEALSALTVPVDPK